MASRNFHKRRTKERKDRQRVERQDAERRELRHHLRRFQGAPIVAGMGMAHGAALAAVLGERALHRPIPLVVADGTGYADRLALVTQQLATTEKA